MTNPTTEDIAAALRDYKTKVDPGAMCGTITRENLANCEVRAGLQFPRAFKEWLLIANGVEMTSAVFNGVGPGHRGGDLLEILRLTPQYRAKQFLPIASDGCGNDYVACLSEANGASPVVFIEGIMGRDVVNHIRASSINHFIYFSILRSMDSESSLWPYDKDFVLQNDPIITSFGYPLPWEV